MTLFCSDEISGTKRNLILEHGVDLMCVIRTCQREGKIGSPIDLWVQLPSALQSQSETVEVATPTADLVICTECRQSFGGFRYKCIQCSDYILCGQCDKAGKHPDHAVIRFMPTVSLLSVVHCTTGMIVNNSLFLSAAVDGMHACSCQTLGRQQRSFRSS